MLVHLKVRLLFQTDEDKSSEASNASGISGANELTGL
jgi:hypothetical protein